MRLHDTATGAVLPLRPRNGRLGMYVCGITPYEGGHVGHAFTYHTFDLIGRRLRGLGIEVRSVRNVTDVDDDILRVARERGLDYRELGDHQVQRFDDDMARLNLRPVDAQPRATGHVAEMVAWIARLLAADAAYSIAGWVYFDVTAFPRYGSLSGLDEQAMVALSRQRGADPDDVRKRHPLDFVLWQPSLPDEPHWESPWSQGRPGWHIECSVLATAELDTPIDIHGGGDDLIYPHHESEIAQAEAGGVDPYVSHWVHVAMVRYQGEKMSKSLGNLVFVRDLLDRVPAAAVRLLLAAHSYRDSWEYREGLLGEAVTRMGLYAAAANSHALIPEEAALALRDEFLQRVDDDLDTPGALRVLDDAVASLASSRWSGAVAARGVIDELLGVLGVELTG